MNVYKPLFALTANDLMSQTLVLVPMQMSLEGAARMLSQAQVTGAPVVDEEGRCVGVLSATDFLHVAERGGHAVKDCQHETPSVYSWQIVEAENDIANRVQGHMTADPVMVRPGTNVGELCQMMVNAHIHRVIVVDEHQRPLGIVSTTDILAAVARTFHLQGGEVNPAKKETEEEANVRETDFVGCG